ncbi:MAG: Stp1/IreP family PP2C-type Ser/Thr phosphatase, partial [candidate division WOR-3 bacterium]
MKNLRASALTDKGVVRQNNEDAFFIDEERGIFIVADGMGGHNAGEVASSLAVTTIKDFLYKKGDIQDSKQIKKALVESIFSAHEEIKKKSEQENSLKGMGTTVVVSYLKDRTLHICSVGDSRGYLIRDKKIIKLTEDHSVVAELLKSGVINEEEAKLHPMKNVITQALGIGTPPIPFFVREQLRDDDLILLCTDGLTEMLTDEEILSTCLQKRNNISDMAKAFIDEANKKGGKDNVTVVL